MRDQSSTKPLVNKVEDILRIVFYQNGAGSLTWFKVNLLRSIIDKVKNWKNRGQTVESKAVFDKVQLGQWSRTVV